MRLRLHTDYGGARTHEQRIAPGDYDADDERLFGLADYLVENGHASWLPDDAVPLASTAPEPPAQTTLSHDEAMTRLGRAIPKERPAYGEWTIAMLQQACEQRGIDLSHVKGSGANGRLLKEDYIAVLEGDDRDAASEAL